MRSLATGWASAPASGTAAAEAAEALATGLEEFTGRLNAHLDEEERLVVPLLAQYLTVQEWQHFGETMNAEMPRSAFPIMLGTILEVATPEEARAFLAELPWPARVLARVAGRRRYAAYIAAVRGGRA